MRIAPALAACLLATAAQADDARHTLPADLQPLARDVLRELVEIDTTHDNGAGAASAAIARRLKAAGFADEDLVLAGDAPNRLNLVARYRGRGEADPILFLVHLDVVAAKPEDWSTPPFQLTEKDGYFYGRGTTDIKEEATDLVVNLIRWRREGWKPAGDLIFAFTDGEEGGGGQAGMDWLLEHRPELVRAAFAINPDSGGGGLKLGRHSAMFLQTSEKVYLSFELKVTDKGGHSSIPTAANPITRLAGALQRIAQNPFELRTNETTRGYFAAMADEEPDPNVAADMRLLARDPIDLAVAARVAAASPSYNARLRTTCVPTEIAGGHAENALPQIARATINCRIHPDESADAVEARLRELAADPGIEFRRMNDAAPSPPSPLRKDVVATLTSVTREMFPAARVVPSMSTGASDSVWLRNRGVPAYGLSGMFTDVDDPRAHGRDERMGIREFYDGIEFMYRFVKELDKSR